MEKEKPERTRKPSIKLFVLVIMILAIALVMFMDFNGENIIFTKFNELISNKHVLVETDIIFSFDYDSQSKFRTIGDKIIKCTKDGIKCYTQKNEEVWNGTFTFSSPIMIYENNITAVSEPKSRNIYVYNEQGPIHNGISTNYPVIRFSVNKNGYVASIEQYGSGYKIVVYDESGVARMERIEEIDSIYPIAVDVSDNNTTLAVSYIDTQNVNMVSRVVFYSWAAGSSENINNIIGSTKDKKDQIIPFVYYMDNDMLIAVSDQEILAVDNTLKESWSKTLTNKIEKISFDAKNYFVAAFSEPITDSAETFTDKVIWYNLSGGIINEYGTKSKVTFLKSASSTTVIGQTRDFTAVGKDGKILWEKELTQDVLEMLPLNKNVLFVSRNEATVLNLVKVAENN